MFYYNLLFIVFKHKYYWNLFSIKNFSILLLNKYDNTILVDRYKLVIYKL